MNTNVFIKINSWAGQYVWLDRFMIFSAEWLGYIMFLALVIVYFKNKTRFKGVVYTAIGSAIVVRLGIVSLIRLFYYHPRPFMVLSHVDQLVDHATESSFPSGHAAFYFALATGVYLYNKKAGLAYLLLAGLIGFARVFVGVHWLLDILAGAGVGVATGLVLNYYFRKINFPSGQGFF